MRPNFEKPLKVFDSTAQFRFIVERLPDSDLTLLERAIRRLRWLRRRWYFVDWYTPLVIGVWG